MILGQLGSPKVPRRMLAEKGGRRVQRGRVWGPDPWPLCEHEERDQTLGYKPDFPAQAAEEPADWPVWLSSDLWPAEVLHLWLLHSQQKERFLHLFQLYCWSPRKESWDNRICCYQLTKSSCWFPWATFINRPFAYTLHYWEALWVLSSLAGTQNHTYPLPHSDATTLLLSFFPLVRENSFLLKAANGAKFMQTPSYLSAIW